MTNAEIILNNSVFLMEQGILKPAEPQEYVTITDDAGTRAVLRPEEIHTFEAWKAKGFIVKKGQHAIAKFPVWKKSKGKRIPDPEDPDKEQQRSGRFFMKMAFFFTEDQVMAI